MSRHINLSQSVDPNTFVFEIHEERHTRLSVLMSRAEVEALCDKARALLGDPVTVVIPGPKLAVFPTPEEQPMKLGIRRTT
jgi:hypothetical protein